MAVVRKLVDDPGEAVVERPGEQVAGSHSGEIEVGISSEQQFQNSMRGRILVVDDENGPRQALRMLLKEEHDVYVAPDVPVAQQILSDHEIDMVITDLRMPKLSGVHLLQWSKTLFPEIEVIILTGYGELDTAINAVEYGALAYVEKPFDADVILNHIEVGLEKRRHDIERRQLEELALEANRFETLGRFVSGMLHDLGTPLSVIGSQIDLIGYQAEEVLPTDRLGTMRTQVNLCSDIVRTAMNFLRHETQRFTIVSLNDIAQSCIDVSKAITMEHTVKVETDFDDELPMCEGDYVLLRQAVLNLITNACQAMEGQGEDRIIHVKTWREDETLFLSINDNGPGIPAKDRDKVFNTFYSTKGERGTGLGLAVVRNVMDRHRGNVVIGENGDRGAQFSLRFPLTMPKLTVRN
jgi:signal transduction histidine kinase